jgi:hypothetical protein
MAAPPPAPKAVEDAITDEFSGMGSAQLKEAMRARGISRDPYDVQDDFRRKLRAYEAENPAPPPPAPAEDDAIERAPTREGCASTFSMALLDPSTRTRVTQALALRDEKSFSKTDRNQNAIDLLNYLAIKGGIKSQYRYDETTPNSELIETFNGNLLDCFDVDERPRVKVVLTDAKSVLAPTTTLARTPRQVVDDLEGFVTNCGYKIKDDGTLEELSEGRQGDFLKPPPGSGGVEKFLKKKSRELGLATTWTQWRKKAPDWAPKTGSGALPRWTSKPAWWLAATAAAHELIDARARLDGVSDEVRTTEKAAAKQAAFTSYYYRVVDDLMKFEVAALEKLDDAGIRKRVAPRVKALEAREKISAQTRGRASVAAGSIPKAQAAKKKAQAQSIAQGTNLSAPRKKKPGGLVPNNCEDGFARQRDRKACFEPADATDWLD